MVDLISDYFAKRKFMVGVFLDVNASFIESGAKVCSVS